MSVYAVVSLPGKQTKWDSSDYQSGCLNTAQRTNAQERRSNDDVEKTMDGLSDRLL